MQEVQVVPRRGEGQACVSFWFYFCAGENCGGSRDRRAGGHGFVFSGGSGLSTVEIESLVTSVTKLM